MRQGAFSFFLWTGLFGLLAGCLSTAKQIAPQASRDLRLSYTFTVQIPSGSGKVDIWIPLPRSDGNQELKSFKVTSPLRYSLQTDPEYGNTILRFETAKVRAENLEVKLDVKVLRLTQTPDGKKASGQLSDSEKNLHRYLQADRLVPIDGRIAEEARRVVKNGRSPLEKAKAIYDYVVETMAYDKSGTGWGRGDALWACDARTGNCTDFHSFFIGMTRASGIPARFVMGFPVPEDKREGEIPGYHCWAEFYVPEIGWVPVDASEAWKHPEKKEFFFGNLDPNRVAFSLGRDIRLDTKLEPLNYLIYPYVLIDGRESSEVRPTVRFADRLN
ncbi:MAG TPA: transglutaminase domain-containing protein [candidate division Zixibacteria bacterium]|nr:transglutaminase domain-containing protein [candidate division Zixibacteria bacterium]